MTTSATGDPRAFTLLEILLAIALIALLSTIVIGGSAALIRTRTATADEQFWKVCADARRQALEDQRSVVVSFDTKTRAFLLSEGDTPRSIPLAASDDVTVDFHPAQSDSSASSSILVGGTLVDTTPLAAVTFYDDGTCTPFRVQFRASGGAHVVDVDPWTCAPILRPSDAAP